MERTYWHKQSADAPLFADLLWSRPENRAYAGKLLIIGGNKYGFAAPATAYAEAEKAGVGTARVLLPASLRRTVGKVFLAGEFAPSNLSGGFARQALDDWLAMAAWADGVLLAGDVGRNSETAIVLETFLQKYAGPAVITKDALDYFLAAPLPLLNRPQTVAVASFAQLQKLGQNAHFPSAFTFDMDLLRLVDTLHDFTEKYPVSVVTKHLDSLFVATSGQVSSTKLAQDLDIWRVWAAAQTAVWYLQNPAKPFEALTTAIIATIA